MAPDLKPHGAGPKLPTDKGRELQKLLSTDQKLLWLLNMAFLTEYLESGSKKKTKKSFVLGSQDFSSYIENTQTVRFVLPKIYYIGWVAER